jgi:hypothetical protein
MRRATPASRIARDARERSQEADRHVGRREAAYRLVLEQTLRKNAGTRTNLERGLRLVSERGEDAVPLNAGLMTAASIPITRS